ncbi:MAG: hypothetical protein AAGH79_00665 [Bacteroidota bacterium]
MKTKLLLTLAIAFVFGGCNNDIDLTADWKNIPVVYALINKEDPVHYLRLEKAFLDENGNAFDAAANIDSIYYGPEVVVEILNQTTGARTVLERVNADEEGLPRDDGVFANSPNILYKFTAADFPLEGEQIMQLIIDGDDLGEPVTAEATVMGDIIPQAPSMPGDKLDFPMDRETSIRWRSTEEIRFFDVFLRINYAEQLISNPDVIEEFSVIWTMGQNIDNAASTQQTVLKVSGQEFYAFLAQSIQPDNDKIRFLQGMDLVISGGGEAVKSFIDISLANTGITSAQEIPVFSNLSEGLGIFSSVADTSVVNLTLTNASRDSLITGSITSELNFQ